MHILFNENSSCLFGGNSVVTGQTLCGCYNYLARFLAGGDDATCFMNMHRFLLLKIAEVDLFLPEYETGSGDFSRHG